MLCFELVGIHLFEDVCDVAFDLDIDIADGHSVFAEAYVKAAEYLFAYTEVIGSWGVRVGYTWKAAV